MANEEKNRLKNIIDELCMTHAQFANSIGFASSYISQIVNGEKEISKKMARKIQEVHQL